MRPLPRASSRWLAFSSSNAIPLAVACVLFPPTSPISPLRKPTCSTPSSALTSGTFRFGKESPTPTSVLKGQWARSSKPSTLSNVSCPALSSFVTPCSDTYAIYPASTKLFQDILQAFTAMTPLFRAPALIGRLSNTLETALRQSPGLLKQMLPSGTLNSEFEQVNDIHDGLAKIQRYYQANITNALSLVQTSFTTFLDFSAEGGFIAPQASLQAQSGVLIAALQTYIVSSCLSQNNIFITLTRDTNPHELVTNGTLGLNTHLVSCDYYNEYGVCSTWWYDAPNNRAFGLSSTEDPQNNFYDLLNEIFGNGWTNPSLLFSGAIDCADYVKNNPGASNQPQLDVNTMHAHCISNTQICVYDQSCAINDRDCEFTGEYGGTDDGPCRPGKNYMTDCGNTYSIVSGRIPAAYLGPMDVYPLVQQIEVCND